jgi:hypothetical protein
MRVVKSFAVPSSSICLYRVIEDNGSTTLLVSIDMEGKALSEPVKYVTFRGFMMYGMRKIDNLLTYGYIDLENVRDNVTDNIKKRNAASRIQRYWRHYQDKKKAINILRPVLIHWAYKPDGPLGKKIILSLTSSISTC